MQLFWHVFYSSELNVYVFCASKIYSFICDIFWRFCQNFKKNSEDVATIQSFCRRIFSSTLHFYQSLRQHFHQHFHQHYCATTFWTILKISSESQKSRTLHNELLNILNQIKNSKYAWNFLLSKIFDFEIDEFTNQSYLFITEFSKKSRVNLSFTFITSFFPKNSIFFLSNSLYIMSLDLKFSDFYSEKEAAKKWFKRLEWELKSLVIEGIISPNKYHQTINLLLIEGALEFVKTHPWGATLLAEPNPTRSLAEADGMN